MCLLHLIGGASSCKPIDLKDGLSTRAADLTKRAFEEIDPSRLVDYHTHVVGVGAGGTGNLLNPSMRRPARHPIKYLKFSVYRSGCGIKDMLNADREFVMRLADQVRHIEHHGKYRLLAFDKNYNPDGTVNLEKTEFYTSNEYVFNMAAEFPDLFIPTMSVHPYRLDAIQELEKWAGRGVKLIKWLPNAMGINPADSKCDAFYQKMRELDVVLLCHTGEEKAVEADEDQLLGNPLHLRRPLDHGVKVIAAHCAGLGENPDLDKPDKPRTPNFDLLMRLMAEKKYEGLLYGDISAMTQQNRLGCLTAILKRDDLHPRLVNGSDYPLPAINIVISTRKLVKNGYINRDERALLNEIYDYNPLLFDFVLKRTMRVPGAEQRLPASVFMANSSLGV
jgi:predicted TIM-barrel fold metal-dependent hydrolase